MSTNSPTDKTANLADLMDQLPQTNYGEQKSWSNGKVRFEFFPEGYIALNKELATGLHPKLEQSLASSPVNETDEKLAKIAAYCGVVLDGVYSLAERDKLCYHLAGRLEVLRELPGPQVIM